MINLILSFNLLTSFQSHAQRQDFFQPGYDAFILSNGKGKLASRTVDYPMKCIFEYVSHERVKQLRESNQQSDCEAVFVFFVQNRHDAGGISDEVT